MFKYIKNFSEFVLNETLKTHDIDLSINNISSEMVKTRYNFNIIKNNNKIELYLYNFRYIQNINILFNHINSLFIDRHGWFPSEMKLVNWAGKKNNFSYNEEYLKDNIEYLEEVCIIYEAKFDNIINPSAILYHLSIQEYENKIINNGLVPKSKSKLSKHLDRIYLCEDVQYCYNLISRMKANYMLKNTPTSKINTKWIIYKVDVENLELDFYQDQNYTNGFYIVDNIDKSRIKIFDKE